MYILYSTRSNGWLTKTSTYSTDISQARIYERDDALAMVRRAKTQASHNLLPVRQEDIQ
jgi:hypothetical protein